MSKDITITTISLPKAMAKDIKAMSKQEGKTVSELIRRAVQLYQIQNYYKRKDVPWEELQKRLLRVSKSGRQVSLSNFVAKDRYSH